jgi:CMP/dCMP kinase
VIIAIDGPAASGKSTVARQVARRLGAHYLDTGAMYRAIALKALRSGVSIEDPEELGRLAREAVIAFEHEGDEAIPSAVLLDGTDVSEAIRSQEVDEAVSPVASAAPVREAMVPLQHSVAAGTHDVVVEGRDIGTVVFPEAAVKIFLTASAEERARRRHAELAGKGVAVEETTVRYGLERRDETDSTRAAAPLLAAPDAVHVDTTGLSVDEVVEVIAGLVEEACR